MRTILPLSGANGAYDWLVLEKEVNTGTGVDAAIGNGAVADYLDANHGGASAVVNRHEFTRSRQFFLLLQKHKKLNGVE